jgi:prophage antirepressor-like protein
MNDMQIFQNSEFGSLEVLEINRKPWFPATKVAEVLGYKNPQEAIRTHCKGVSETLRGVQTGIKADGTPAMQDVVVKIIPEGDIYRLIVRSKLPSAERFERWVFDEVLPSLRRHGLYAAEDLIANPDLLIQAATALKEERARTALLTETVAVQKQQIAEMKPKASYYDLILQCKGVLPITVIAKDYGKSAKWLNAYLKDLGVQYKVGGTWVLYQQYAGQGYTQTKTHEFVNQKTGLPDSAVNMYWTQKGRLFLYETLKNNGLLPTIERSPYEQAAEDFAEVEYA